MSVYATSWVWKHSRSEGTDRLVLLAIADSADHDGTNAWPRLSKVAAMVRVSTRTVQRSIASLVVMGELVVELHAGGAADADPRYRPNRYALPLMSRGDNPVAPSGSGVTKTPFRGDKKGDSDTTTVSPLRTSLEHPERAPGSFPDAFLRAPDITPPEQLSERLAGIRASIANHPATP